MSVDVTIINNDNNNKFIILCDHLHIAIQKTLFLCLT